MRLEGNDLILRCRELADVAKKAADEDLCRILRAVGTDVRSYAFKERMKSPKAIEKKVRRKRLEGARMRAAHERDRTRLDGGPTSGDPVARLAADKLCAAANKAEAYDPDHVTDVWRCRYVTLYQSKIPPTVEALLTRLRGGASPYEGRSGKPSEHRGRVTAGGVEAPGVVPRVRRRARTSLVGCWRSSRIGFRRRIAVYPARRSVAASREPAPMFRPRCWDRPAARKLGRARRIPAPPTA